MTITAADNNVLTEALKEKPIGYQDEFYKHDGRRMLEDREDEDVEFIRGEYWDGRAYGFE